LKTNWLCALLGFLLLLICHANARERWSSEQANDWQSKTPWLVGSNFTPSTAINQLEMWQADTFDAATIDRELGWADGLGFNSMRVFLHHLPYEQDPDGFLKRIDQFLSIADKHHIGVMFVLFDSCWDPNPHLGKQHEPVKGLHNSGWVQSPGAKDLKDASRRPVLEAYVKAVIGHFKDDKRVQVWDIWNEPDNDNGSSYGLRNRNEELPNKLELTMQLLPLAFDWARAADPSQPITSGIWKGFQDNPAFDHCETIQLDQSDVTSFHGYDNLDTMKKRVAKLRPLARPILCTEYMARPNGSHFDPILGYLKSEHIAAYNWGFVAGKTNTIYPWDSWQHPYDAEPKVWFHDIFRAEGSPFDPKEVGYIRSVTGK
jgi:glycosyl hydrolase family 10